MYPETFLLIHGLVIARLPAYMGQRPGSAARLSLS